jgi:hypothetical protein
MCWLYACKNPQNQSFVFVGLELECVNEWALAAESKVGFPSPPIRDDGIAGFGRWHLLLPVDLLAFVVCLMAFVGVGPVISGQQQEMGAISFRPLPVLSPRALASADQRHGLRQQASSSSSAQAQVRGSKCTGEGTIMVRGRRNWQEDERRRKKQMEFFDENEGKNVSQFSKNEFPDNFTINQDFYL